MERTLYKTERRRLQTEVKIVSHKDKPRIWLPAFEYLTVLQQGASTFPPRTESAGQNRAVLQRSNGKVAVSLTEVDNLRYACM